MHPLGSCGTPLSSPRPKHVPRWLLPGDSAWFPNLFELYFRYVSSGIDARTSEQRAVTTALTPCLKPGQRILELGSGTGHYTVILHDSGAQICARDASPAMVRYLTRRLSSAGVLDIDVDLGRFPDDLRIEGTFDGVLTVGMLNYLPDLNEALARIAELLKPSGWTVFNVPRQDRMGRRYANIELLGRRRVYLPSIEHVQEAVTNAGLRLTHGPVDAGVTAVYRCENPQTVARERAGLD